MKYIKPLMISVFLVAATFFASMFLQQGRHIDFQNTLVFAGILYMISALFLMFAGEKTYERQPVKSRPASLWPIGILFAGIVLFLSSFVV